MSVLILGFAHGANDVANAIGPLTGIVSAIGAAGTDGAGVPQFWVVMIGAIGISLDVTEQRLAQQELEQSEGRLRTILQTAPDAILTTDDQGLILPLLASATGTFFFRQFFKSVPDELLEAARIDNAGPFKFFVDILLPLSRTMIAAVFIIMFVYGWNQYLWPMLMTTDESFYTLMRGIKQILQVWVGSQIPDYNEAFAMAVLALLPPVIVVVVFQSWFIKGLTETDK